MMEIFTRVKSLIQKQILYHICQNIKNIIIWFDENIRNTTKIVVANKIINQIMKNIQEIKRTLKTKTKSLIVKVNGNRKEVERFYLPEFPVCHPLRNVCFN